MAILKHISVKNRFYSSAVEYLTCQFDEYTNKPVLDEKGRIQERENYLIAGVNCDVDSFGAECIEVNRLYGKNNSVKDVKAIIILSALSLMIRLPWSRRWNLANSGWMYSHRGIRRWLQFIRTVTMAVRICTSTWLSIPSESMPESKAGGMISFVNGNRAVSTRVRGR